MPKNVLVNSRDLRANNRSNIREIYLLKSKIYKKNIDIDIMEKLDLANVIEIDRIRKVLIRHPDLLSMFEILVIVANKRLNEEKVVDRMALEDYIEPDLSDHESDED